MQLERPTPVSAVPPPARPARVAQHDQAHGHEFARLLARLSSADANQGALVKGQADLAPKPEEAPSSDGADDADLAEAWSGLETEGTGEFALPPVCDLPVSDADLAVPDGLAGAVAVNIPPDPLSDFLHAGDGAYWSSAPEAQDGSDAQTRPTAPGAPQVASATPAGAQAGDHAAPRADPEMHVPIEPPQRATQSLRFRADLSVPPSGGDGAVIAGTVADALHQASFAAAPEQASRPTSAAADIWVADMSLPLAAAPVPSAMSDTPGLLLAELPDAISIDALTDAPSTDSLAVRAGDAAGAAPGPDLRAPVRMPDLQAMAHLREALSQALAQSEQIEIDLGRDGLGRLGLTVQVQDGVLQIVLMSARPETLDLVRRSLPALLRDLATLGYGEIDVRMPHPPPQQGRSIDPKGARLPFLPVAPHAPQVDWRV